MLSIPNYKYYESFPSVHIKNKLKELGKHSLLQKIADIVQQALKYIADFCILSGGMFICFGTGFLNISFVLLGGAGVLIGAICRKCGNTQTRAVKLEKAASCLIRASSLADEGHYYKAVDEIEKARDILPESDVPHTHIYLNQCLKHLRLRNKEKAISAAKQLIQQTEEEIDYFSRQKNIWPKLIDYLQNRVRFGKAVRDRYDMISQSLDTLLICKKREFRHLYQELAERGIFQGLT